MRSARLIFGAMAIDTPNSFDTRSLYKMAVRRRSRTVFNECHQVIT